MASTDSSHVFRSGEVVRCEARPVEADRLHFHHWPHHSMFLIGVTTNFTLRPSPTRDQSSAVGSLVTTAGFPLSLPAVARAGAGARNSVVCMLAVAGVLPHAGEAPAVERCNLVHVDFDVDVLVDELPEVRHGEGVGQDGLLSFVPASEESIKGLERVRVDGVSEKECAVCLEDNPVGLEATRLPCSHHFHGDCILKWLNISKFCPLCRFELPS